MGLYEVVRGGTEWYGVVRGGTLLYGGCGVVGDGSGSYGMIRSSTEWYGVRGCMEWYVVVRGSTGLYGVVRSGVIDPAWDIRSILLVNGST